jgi:hypothetical protein
MVKKSHPHSSAPQNCLYFSQKPFIITGLWLKPVFSRTTELNWSKINSVVAFLFSYIFYFIVNRHKSHIYTENMEFLLFSFYLSILKHDLLFPRK